MDMFNDPAYDNDKLLVRKLVAVCNGALHAHIDDLLDLYLMLKKQEYEYVVLGSIMCHEFSGRVTTDNYPFSPDKLPAIEEAYYKSNSSLDINTVVGVVSRFIAGYLCADHHETYKAIWDNKEMRWKNLLD